MRLPILKYDKRIFDEAMGLAVAEQAKQIEVKEIELQVHYITNFGQEVYIIGSNKFLGNWNAEDKG